MWRWQHMFLLVSVFVASCTCDEHYVSSHGGLTDKEVSYRKQRQLLYYRDEFGSEGRTSPSTRHWFLKTRALDNKRIRTVSGIDLNHGDIVGCLPEELGLLTDLALFHINSNRFCGTVPHKFIKLKLMLELDLSNNWFTGKFLEVILKLPLLKFLDLRFNEFEGTIPKELFDKDLDVIFINHNRFRFNLPDNFGNSHVYVIVLANNKFHGCMPGSLGKTTGLEEISLMNNGFRSCLPEKFGGLKIKNGLNICIYF
ncbi:hypothetical protein Gotur_021297 [Gossypium turneri]